MILELSDDEIMDFLMTSDFSGDFTPDELKYLLNKWRYFYRLSHGKNETMKSENEFEKRKLEEESRQKDIKINELLFDLSNKQNMIDSLVNRKLTLKERFSGKIIPKN